MSYIKALFDKNFLEYASYVIRDRAIPDLEDGLKPVQRRIMHTLFEMDDGKFHKVANVVGACMKYHPHGDASIGDALVVLANKDLFIDCQGNFGNIYTGDAASAARYIECRVTSLAKEVLHNPKLTPMADSYDGRNKEPLAFPAKIPTVLALGAEGIAVGMSTRILPHNLVEILEAEKSCLAGKAFKLYPDFPTGGLVDVSEYKDGNGKVLVRAKLDVSDPKRILIRELPYGSTTESLIASVESAAKAGRVKIQAISDFTSDKVEIEIKLARGVYSEETVDALFAFTECEQSIAVNLLVIKDGLPSLMSVTDVIKHHAAQLVSILTKELELERGELREKLRQRTLERIFIEERIYKRIETMKSAETVVTAVIDGFTPFLAEIGPSGVKPEDVDRLLKIPIRRISLYDINKARADMKEMEARLKEIASLLKNINAYALSYLDGIIQRVKADPDLNKGVRRTKVGKFDKIAAKEVVKSDIALRYDPEFGYLGTTIAGGDLVAMVSPFDRVLVLRAEGSFSVIDVPDKAFVGKGVWWCGVADKDELSKTVFTVLYKDKTSAYPYIKRCRVEGWIINKEYSLLPEGSELLHIDAREKFTFVVRYVPKPRMKLTKESFKAQDYIVKGLKASGVRLASKAMAGLDVKLDLPKNGNTVKNGDKY